MAGNLEIQDGGCQTGNNYISACRLDSVEISTAKPMFSMSSNATAHGDKAQRNRKWQIQDGFSHTGKNTHFGT